MAQKMFGGSSGSKFSGKSAFSDRGTKPASNRGDSPKKKKSRSRLRPVKVILSILLVLEIFYCLAIFTNIPVLSDLRSMYIKTAMSTMRHRWLATALIPKDIVDEVVRLTEDARDDQIGNNSSWEDVDIPATAPPENGGSENSGSENNQSPPPVTAPAQGETLTPEQESFFALFHELDQKSTLEYVKKNPDAVINGWDKLYINKAGLDDKGTSIKTTAGDTVLAIDAVNQVLLIRVTGSSYRGVLAIAKDPSRLSLEVSATIGTSGQRAGKIASKHNGVLAMTASGFQDDGGVGNGGVATGAYVSNGKEYGDHFKWGYKRIELRKNDRMYVVDAPTSTHKDTTDAAEFWPALVVNGENALGKNNIFTDLHPRAAIGQKKNGEIMMLVIEGRSITSLGAVALDCTEILLRYDCYQGMCMDGGTSAILWFDGEYVTKCSNASLKEGRLLPNAWVYKKASE